MTKEFGGLRSERLEGQRGLVTIWVCLVTNKLHDEGHDQVSLTKDPVARQCIHSSGDSLYTVICTTITVLTAKVKEEEKNYFLLSNEE